MCSWQGQSNGHAGDLMVNFAEVATIEKQEWKELILNEAGQEMTKERIASAHAQGNVIRKTKEQKRKLCSSGLSDPSIYFCPS